MSSVEVDGQARQPLNRRGSSPSLETAAAEATTSVLSDQFFRPLIVSEETSVADGLKAAGAALQSHEPKKASAIFSFDVERQISRGKLSSVGGARLGTMLGVYLPTVQNIFGVIMFLRLHWIVGVAGIAETLVIVGLCCIVTLSTSISLSAIATNGLVEEGGPYYVISRNLSADFGAAIGFLFFIANAIATAMYTAGFAEVLLTYVAPDLPQVGEAGNRTATDVDNNFRIYGTILLFVFFLVVAQGVTFTQLFAPISLLCVIASILGNFAGVFTVNESNSPRICLLGDKLLKEAVFLPGTVEEGCHKGMNGSLWNAYCSWNQNASDYYCDPYFVNQETRVIAGVPGLFSGIISDNFKPNYMKLGEALPATAGNKNVEVVQDITSTFFVLLAIFFPAVTGILTGCNIAGDLEDARRSLPSGTIGAQLTTSFVFFAYVFFYGGAVHGALLRDKYGEALGGEMVSSKFSWPTPWLMVIGCLGSTFGAGLQSVLSAPRLLQSVAKDDLIPPLSVFAKLTAKKEPFRALFVTVFIAECAILIGAIDNIAPVVDFFFLICYCSINIVCALQTLLGFPNWRPTFRYYHWSISLIGAMIGFFIMFSTYWYYALLVIALCLLIARYVQRKGARKPWGSGLQGLALATAQLSLLHTDEKEVNPKNWRPQLLLLSKWHPDQPSITDVNLLNFVSHLQAGKGLTFAVCFINGDNSRKSIRNRAVEIQLELKKLMVKYELRGFATVVPCNNIAEAASAFIIGSGIAGLRPNTVVLGWPSRQGSDPQYRAFMYATHKAATIDKCLLVLKGTIPNIPQSGYIDVWWLMHDGGILLLLSFLLRQHPVWRMCMLRVVVIPDEKDDPDEIKRDLQMYLYQLRINAIVLVVSLSGEGASISPFMYSKKLLVKKKWRWLKRFHIVTQKEARTAWKDSEAMARMEDSSIGSETLRSDVTIEPEPAPFAEDAQSWSQSTESGSFSVNMKELQERATAEADKDEALWQQIWMADPGLKTALQLNEVMYEHSSTSPLIVVNLPSPPGSPANIPMYMDYLEIMADGLKLVLLVRGCGSEVITVY